MADHTPGPCGCYVSLTFEVGRPPGTVFHYCPTHAAAPDLLAALEEIAGSHLTNRTANALGFESADPPQHCTDLVRIARAAIARAKGEA